MWVRCKSPKVDLGPGCPCQKYHRRCQIWQWAQLHPIKSVLHPTSVRSLVKPSKTRSIRLSLLCAQITFSRHGPWNFWVHLGCALCPPWAHGSLHAKCIGHRVVHNTSCTASPLSCPCRRGATTPTRRHPRWARSGCNPGISWDHPVRPLEQWCGGGTPYSSTGCYAPWSCAPHLPLLPAGRYFDMAKVHGSELILNLVFPRETWRCLIFLVARSAAGTIANTREPSNLRLRSKKRPAEHNPHTHHNHHRHSNFHHRSHWDDTSHTNKGARTPLLVSNGRTDVRTVRDIRIE